MSSKIIPDGSGNFELAPGITDAAGLLGDLLAQNFGSLVPTGGSLLLAKVALTAAQLRSLDSSPVLIIAAPGAGKAIIPIYSLLIFTPGVVPFTNANDNALLLYGNDLGSGVSATNGLGFDGTLLIQQFATSPPSAFIAGNEVDIDTVFNQPLYYLDSEGDALLGDGTAILYVVYTVIQ